MTQEPKSDPKTQEAGEAQTQEVAMNDESAKTAESKKEVVIPEVIEDEPKTVPLTRAEKNAAEKAAEHRERMVRTAIACFFGMITGAVSFILIGDTTTPLGESRSILGLLLLLAGIVFQKHMFILLKIDYTKLGGKDWFYQAFMTFAFWFISWTILLTL